MDRQTQIELDTLYGAYRDALDQIARASDDDERVHAWRKVQLLGWHLHETLPAAIESLPG